MRPDASLIDAIAVTEPRKASLYFDIKRNTLDDGPGIRSVVFFRAARCLVPGARIRKASTPVTNSPMMQRSASAVTTVLTPAPSRRST